MRTTQQGHYAAMQPASVTANRTTPEELWQQQKQNITDDLPDRNYMVCQRVQKFFF
jgi:hypothetical protein